MCELKSNSQCRELTQINMNNFCFVSFFCIFALLSEKHENIEIQNI